MDNGANAVCLVDADVLAHAFAFIGEYDDKDEETGEVLAHHIRPFAYLIPAIEARVEEIMEACNTTVEPIMFLSGDTNFRYDIAKTKPYKGNRKDLEKPFHFENVRVFIRSRYNTYVSKGCEADDLLAMSMTQYRKDDVPCVLCTIDKDLLQVEGWHYSWETHNSPEKPLHFVDDFGWLHGEYKEGVSEKTGKPTRKFVKLTGEGYLWFMAQTLTGDTTDNIAGLKGCGAGSAYELLKDAQTKEEAFTIVTQAYDEKFGQGWETHMEEQARLVYMIRERDSNSPDGLKHWSLKDAKESTKD